MLNITLLKSGMLNLVVRRNIKEVKLFQTKRIIPQVNDGCQINSIIASITSSPQKNKIFAIVYPSFGPVSSILLFSFYSFVAQFFVNIILLPNKHKTSTSRPPHTCYRVVISRKAKGAVVLCFLYRTKYN